MRMARDWNNDLMQRQAALFREQLARFSTAVETRDRLVAYRWADVIRASNTLTPWLLETRSIPKGKEKAAEMAFRLFMSASRTPRDVFAWAAKNQRHIATYVEALTWPEKSEAAEDSEELFPFEGFTVHNTLNLTGNKLDGTKEVIRRAVKVVRSMGGVPSVSGILYGDLFIVGRLKQPRTLAWYNGTTDEVFIRAHLKVGVDEVHNLVHELGHRYWYKKMSREARTKWSTYHLFLDFVRPEVTLPGPGDVFPIPITGRKTPTVVERVDGGTIHFVGGGSVSAFKTKQILQKDLSYPTPYAATSAEEHFAEAFAMYGLGSLRPDHAQAFEAIVIRGESFDPRAVRVAARWLGVR